jgi:hypothetical protein
MERALSDGRFRDELWDLVIKLECAYETRPAVEKIFARRIK